MPPWIERVVQRIEPRHSWDDLHLPDDTMAILQKIKTQIETERPAALIGRSAASDVTALFSGPELWPKMAAAEALAKSVETDLYRIDVSMLVSETLLETERIIKRILDAADDAGGALFFDASDPLIEPSEDDPYPERGGAYLLKRMTKFAGLTILSVTDRRKVDPALVRRFRYTVNFPG